MTKVRVTLIAAGGAVALVAAAMLWPRAGIRTAGTMPQEVYVWQRVWRQPLRKAMERAAAHVAGLVVLGAQVQWQAGSPRVVRVPLDYALLRRTRKPIGIALRIGSYPGPFERNDAVATLLIQLVQSLLDDAADHDLAVNELQIDFDCASSKLDGYRVWVSAMRQARAQAVKHRIKTPAECSWVLMHDQ